MGKVKKESEDLEKTVEKEGESVKKEAIAAIEEEKIKEILPPEEEKPELKKEDPLAAAIEEETEETEEQTKIEPIEQSTSYNPISEQAETESYSTEETSPESKKDYQYSKTDSKKEYEELKETDAAVRKLDEEHFNPEKILGKRQKVYFESENMLQNKERNKRLDDEQNKKEEYS